MRRLTFLLLAVLCSPVHASEVLDPAFTFYCTFQKRFKGGTVSCDAQGRLCVQNAGHGDDHASLGDDDHAPGTPNPYPSRCGGTEVDKKNHFLVECTDGFSMSVEAGDAVLNLRDGFQLTGIAQETEKRKASLLIRDFDKDDSKSYQRATLEAETDKLKRYAGSCRFSRIDDN